MLFRCCGSGSNGNSYALISDSGQILALEAGVKMTEFKKMIGWRISDVVAAIISHGHGDHSRHIQDFLDMGIKVYMPYTVKAKYGQNNAVQIEPMKPTKIGFATVTAFEVPHTTFDRETGQLVPCVNYGYYIEADGQRILFQTDLTYCPLNFAKRKLNVIITECNYTKELVEREESNFAHVLMGHMELETCLEFLKVNRSSQLRQVILTHLSASHADKAVILKRAKEICGCDCFVAEKGLETRLRMVYPWEE